MYDYDVINKMCEQINLLEYAEQSYDFIKKGADSFATHCCKHIDKTPSLFISPSKNLFHCCSCHIGGNIITWMKEVEGLSFSQSVEKLSQLTNTTLVDNKPAEILQMFRKIKKVSERKIELIERPILDLQVNYFDIFTNEYPQEWVDEGIDPDVMRQYEILIDSKANRIVYPVYDADFHLIGVKGRTRYANFKDLGIQKYMNYNKIGKGNYFTGMKYQYEWIKNNKSCLLFEGIKSCMKCEGWGIHGAIACETSHINEDQVKILIQLGIKEVTFCFDTDCEIQSIIKSTTMLRRFCNVYVVQDRFSENKLLQEKMAPVDAGEDVFRILLEERKKI